MTKSVLVDLRRCIGCRACQVACKRWNNRKAETTTLNTTPGREWTNPPDLSPQTYTYIRFVSEGGSDAFKWHFAKVQCMHCQEPQCAAVCPTQALYKTAEGPVLWDQELCIGCGYCLQGCPFGIPRFDEESKQIEKCTFCAERLLNDLEPACIQACPTDTLVIGESAQILEKVNTLEAAGNSVYGKNEAGGTSWIYVSDVPLEELGFPKVSSEIPSSKTFNLLTEVGAIGVAGALALTGLKLYSDRRTKIAKEE